MMQFIRSNWSSFFAAFVGAVLSLLASPLVMQVWQHVNDVSDASHPPARATVADAVYADERTLQMRFFVQRARDCDFLRLTGFSGRSLLDMQPATVRRADGEDPVSFPVGLTVLSNWWYVAPVAGPLVRLYAYYDCDGRLVRTLLIDTEVRP